MRSREALAERVGEADVVVASGLWDNALLERAGRLRFIQSVSAGTDNFDLDAIRRQGVRLASARGGNAAAVAHHAMGLVLALARRLPEARDNQAARKWRPMQGDPARREDELTGQTMVIVGLGAIGGRLARLAKAFDMRVLGVRRDVGAGAQGADSVHALSDLPVLLGAADWVVLTCPLTPDTAGLIDAAALARMKPGAALVNVARGGCVIESDLVEALASGRIAGAGLDTFAREPLPAESPLWSAPNVLVTPHSAGETRSYERNVIGLLTDNLGRLRSGQALRNGIV